MNKHYIYDKRNLYENAIKLITLYQQGSLGGEIMPEDSNPKLAKDSMENHLYFTLPMALNYQRNSYKLWEAANKTYIDLSTSEAFCPKKVISLSDVELRQKLTKYKVALQPNKQPIIWRTLCNTFYHDFGGDIRNMIKICDNSVAKIKEYMLKNKKSFPYLSGNKIINYWLYVIEQYTSTEFIDRHNITIAPDTHVIQSSVKLGIITIEESKLNKVGITVAKRWNDVLKETNLCPIDVHTPMWLWSRGGFEVDLEG